MKILWSSDAVAQTGFARVTHNVVGRVHGVDDIEVAVLGVNYVGDPHRYPYPIYPAGNRAEHDLYGIARLGEVCEYTQPDLIVLVNDPWNVAEFIQRAKQPVPMMAYMPVDGANMKPDIAITLNQLSLAVFYTEFGLLQARNGGFTGRAMVIPHGIDSTIYSPVPQAEARHVLGFDRTLASDPFIVLNANRNQPRKRLDLTIAWWAQWWNAQGKPDDAYLYLHAANHDIGWDLIQLAKYFGMNKQMIVTSLRHDASSGVAEEKLSYVYSAADVQVSTTQGEGWGLTTHEGMACGAPQLLPDWSALGEWTRGAARLVRCDQIAVTPEQINVIGGIANQQEWMDGLTAYRTDPDYRRHMSNLAFARAHETRLTWADVTARFREAFTLAMTEETYGHALPEQTGDQRRRDEGTGAAGTSTKPAAEEVTR